MKSGTGGVPGFCKEKGYRMPATIKDIKEETGLSLATISKYLNGGNVLPRNKELIEAAIKKLHYEVNEIARGLVTNSTRTIGVSVFDITDMFCSMILHRIGVELGKLGYGVLIVDSSADPERERNNIRFLVNKKVDGILCIPASTNSYVLKSAFDAEIPVVLIDRQFRDRSLDGVTVNNREAAAGAVNYLINRGHKKIAVISGSEESTSRERFRGYRDAMEDAGLAIPKEYVMNTGTATTKYGYTAMQELLKLTDRPTAVLCTNYGINLGVVMALNEAQVSYPEDISVVGFDNLLLSNVLKTRLTVVEQPMERFGQKGVEILMQRIREKKEKKGINEEGHINVILSTHLFEGDSVATIHS